MALKRVCSEESVKHKDLLSFLIKKTFGEDGWGLFDFINFDKAMYLKMTTNKEC